MNTVMLPKQRDFDRFVLPEGLVDSLGRIFDKQPRGKGVKTRVRGKAAEMFIYDEIDPFWGIGAKQFAEDLDAIGEVDTILLRINSPGGDVFHGLSIYNQLLRNGARIEVDIDGLAASMASVIAMAGDEIRIASNAQMMIHDPWTIAMGNAIELRDVADLLETTGDQLANTYVARTGNDKDDVIEWMAAETWMTSDDAEEMGFVDSVVDAKMAAASALGQFDLGKFKNTPKVVVEARNKWCKHRSELGSRIAMTRAELGLKA